MPANSADATHLGATTAELVGLNWLEKLSWLVIQGYFHGYMGFQIVGRQMTL